MAEFVVELDVPEELIDFASEAVELTIDALQVLIDKQLDYGPDNINSFGEFGVLVRDNDKTMRLKNLYTNNIKPVYESVDDSWLDKQNYALIARMLRKGVWPQ